MEIKPKPPRVGKLRSVGDVITEMGRIYRAARRGELDSPVASRLAGILSQLRACIENGEMEWRIEELERQFRGELE